MKPGFAKKVNAVEGTEKRGLELLEQMPDIFHAAGFKALARSIQVGAQMLRALREAGHITRISKGIWRKEK